MNDMTTAPQPFLALVDDDLHSSRLMTRMLLAHRAPAVEALDGSRAAAAKLGPLLADPDAQLPGLVLVDLKETAEATRDFIAGLVKLPRGGELVVAAMAGTASAGTASAGTASARTASADRYHPSVYEPPFTAAWAAPVLTADPPFGRPGTEVRITGATFHRGIEVFFGTDPMPMLARLEEMARAAADNQRPNA